MSTLSPARPVAAPSVPAPLAALTGFLQLLAKRPSGLVGFLGIVFFFLLAFVAPFFVTGSTDPDASSVYLRPSLDHLLGTDFAGRDVMNQIVQNGREVIGVAVVTAFISTLIAVTFGSLSATIGGWTDTTIMGITDVVLTIPQLPVLIVVAALARPTNLIALAVVLSLLGWAGLLRQIRSQVLTLKERDYVEAARSLDLGIMHIIFREILPNMRSYIVIHFVLAMTHAIYAQVALVLLGLVPFSGKNWAVMIFFADSQGSIYFKDGLWYVLAPIMAIVLLQLSLVLFVNALEDIFNPRLRSS